MNSIKLTTLLLLLLGLASCSQYEVSRSDLDDQLMTRLIDQGGSLSYFIQPDSDDYSNIPNDPKNPITADKVELGKMLFHEAGLAINSEFAEGINTYSCASCHHAAGGFQANLAQGIGDGGVGFGLEGEFRFMNPHWDGTKADVQPIRTPSALNVAYQTNLLWNGQFGATMLNNGTEHYWTEGTPLETNHLGYEGAETQAIAGLGVHRLEVSRENEYIMDSEYKDMFDEIFSDIPEEDRYTNEYAGLAIAAYERTLLPNQSPFQNWLKGDESAMTETQKQGAILFIENKCTDCHTGPALSSMSFHAYGMGDLSMDNTGVLNVRDVEPVNFGRASFTGKSYDRYKFKVPQLYNLKDSPFYGHGSTFNSVYDVVQYKNQGVPENPNVATAKLADQFEPLGLTEDEVLAITDFIENGLYDPNLSRYEPSHVPTGMCFPNNDPISQEDLQCN